MKQRIATAVVAAAMGMGATAANASLVLLTPVDFGATGLGAVNTVLTIQGTGNVTTESGSVSWNGSTDITSDDAKIGASQTQTRTLAELGVTSAATLRVVFNGAEPTSDISIQLDDLVLNIFDPSGTLLFTSGAFDPTFFTSVEAGTGNSGFVFGLDAGQAATAQAQAFSGAFGSNRVGLSAAASLATGGVETFFVAEAPGRPPLVGPVPEPGTWALLGSGLLALGGVARRKSKRLG